MILLLAGTSEARVIADGLVAAGRPALASLSGATREPRPLPIPTRLGGFGGADGFVDVLISQGVTKVIDATHPFAHRITNRSARVCAERGVPYLQVLRPPWVAQPGDTWHQIDREEEAASVIEPGQTVFLATGRQTLDRFANLAGCDVICRQIDPPDGAFPFQGGRYLVGRPPFSVEEETTLFQQLGVDWLVVKNAGGAASETKLIAARNLGLPVLMLSRPQRPNAPMVESAEEALAWAAT